MAGLTSPPVLALDINASRVRAVGGTVGEPPAICSLDGKHEDLPLAVSLQGRTPEVGRAGLALARRSPHLACLHFLPELGRPRRWGSERHHLSADQAFDLVLGRLELAEHRCGGLVLVLPPYLTPDQVNGVANAVQEAGLPLLGSISALLAACLLSFADRTDPKPVVVIDSDDHVLTMATVASVDGRAHVLDTRVLPALSLRAWKERLLTAVAERCIRQSRRDPRDSALAEQALYDGLESVLDGCRQGRLVELAIQTPQWYQNILLQPEETVRFCAGLVKSAVDSLASLVAGFRAEDFPRSAVLTAAAGRLPGLAAAVGSRLADLAPREDPGPTDEFSIVLPDEEGDDPPRVGVLPPEMPARAAHALAALFLRRELPAGHLPTSAPLPVAGPGGTGYPRLHFQGRDFPLDRNSFSIGRQPNCDLVFDGSAYPGVSAWHCEIVCDQRNYLLRDWSRSGTLVNDRPVDQQVTLRSGDWIRLGPDGPVLRFLGQGAGPQRLVTTA